MNLTSSPDLSLRNLVRAQCDAGSNLLSDDGHYFRRGRDALWQGLRSLGLSAGDRVLIPSSLCTAAITPMISLGLRTVAYRISDNFDPDLEDIEAKLSAGARAVLAVHFWGYPTDLSKMRDLCDANDAWLIEDCAQTMLGSFDGRDVGSNGHVSVFSFKKFLPTHQGGLLRIKDSRIKIENQPFRSFDKNSLIHAVSSNLKNKRGLSKLLTLTKSTINSTDTADGQEVFPNDVTDNFGDGCSRIDARIFRHSCLEEIAVKRIDNAQTWMNALSDRPGYRPVFDILKPGAVPQSVPFIVDNASNTAQMLKNLGIPSEISVNRPFYGAPNLDNPEELFPNIERLARTVINLPNHQSLSTKLIRRAASQIIGR